MKTNLSLLLLMAVFVGKANAQIDFEKNSRAVFHFNGIVIDKVPEGLIASGEIVFYEMPRNRIAQYGLILLRNHPKQSKLLDGDPFRCIISYDGVFNFAERQIRKFTYSIEEPEGSQP